MNITVLFYVTCFTLNVMQRLRALHNQQETAADAPPRTELTLWHCAVALLQSVRQAVVCRLLLEPHRSTHHKEREREKEKERKRERERDSTPI